MSITRPPGERGVGRPSDRRAGLRFEAVRDEPFLVAVGPAARFAAAARAVTLALEPHEPRIPLERSWPEGGAPPALQRLVVLAGRIVVT